MKKFKLTREEKAVEAESLRGDYRPVPKAEFDEIVRALERRRKDTMISIRVNGEDLANLKKKAKMRGVPYQTIVSELIHRYSA